MNEASAPAIPLAPRTYRLESLDLLRGLLMILMALDHTRDYFTCLSIDPASPVTASPALFATRWVTHLCAPGFIALAGASTYLQRQRGKSTGQVARLLWTRGLWLMFLEVTLISFGWSFAFAPFLQVIWAVGFAMIVLAQLQRLPVWAVGTIGAAIVCGHNLLDPIRASDFGSYANLWKIVHQSDMLLYHGHPIALAFYPLLPWVGVICLGYAFGPLAASAPAFRQRVSLGLAATFFTVFTVLRFVHGYGNDRPFVPMAKPAHTLMSFLNVEKYPPSLQYVLITFSVLLVLYAAFDAACARDWLPHVRNFFETFGRVPFFYYVPHIYILHTLALLVTMAEHLNWRTWITAGGGIFAEPQPGWGFGLPVIYGIWIGVVLALYLPCRWFAGVKARRRDWWLSYL